MVDGLEECMMVSTYAFVIGYGITLLYQVLCLGINAVKNMFKKVTNTK